MSEDTTLIDKLPSATAFLQKQVASAKAHIKDMPARTLPRDSSRHKLDAPLSIVLLHPTTDDMPLSVELMGDVIIGHSECDIDLTVWGAVDKGVSQQHALLRPQADHMYLIDLASTNGTHLNGMPMSTSRARRLNDGDVITLGELHIGVRME